MKNITKLTIAGGSLSGLSILLYAATELILNGGMPVVKQFGMAMFAVGVLLIAADRLSL